MTEIILKQTIEPSSPLRPEQSGKAGIAGLLTLLCLCTTLPACTDASGRPGQTLARVNGEDITILLVNEELKHSSSNLTETSPVTTQLLETLIDRQLLTEEAMRHKLHRSPEVMLAIEREKTAIIARAYMDSLAANLPEPDESQIRQHYDTYPAYYSQRLTLDLQQLILPASAIKADLRSALNRASTLEQAASLLDRNRIHQLRESITLSTLDFPYAVAEKLLKMRTGDLFMLEEDGELLLRRISAIRQTPVSLAEATPDILDQLHQAKAREVINTELARLKAAAQIIRYSMAPGGNNQ